MGQKKKKKKKLTPLEALDALFDFFLVPLSFFPLFHLDLLPKLFPLPLALLLLAPLDPRRLVYQSLADPLHVRVGFHHLGVKVGGACERQAVFSRQCACGVRSVESLFIARTRKRKKD